MRQPTVITIQCVTICTFEAFYVCMILCHDCIFISCHAFIYAFLVFYHVCILRKMLCQKWRNKQTTTQCHRHPTICFPHVPIHWLANRRTGTYRLMILQKNANRHEIWLIKKYMNCIVWRCYLKYWYMTLSCQRCWSNLSKFYKNYTKWRFPHLQPSAWIVNVGKSTEFSEF